MTFNGSKVSNLDQHYRHSLIESIVKPKLSGNLINNIQYMDTQKEFHRELIQYEGTNVIADSPSEKMNTGQSSIIRNNNNFKETSDQI